MLIRVAARWWTENMNVIDGSLVSRCAPVIALLAAIACATGVQADAIEAAGKFLTFAMPAAAGAISLGKGDRDGVLELGLAYAGAVGTTLALKSVVHEWRPDHSDERSFPSGAATSAFASAAYVDKRYGWHYGLPAYALATFVGYTRVEADKHHWHDVAAGALIGWTFNQLITTHREKGLYVAPMVSTEAIGLELRLHW
jgi:membrane-associated phospholipid phosphatase